MIESTNAKTELAGVYATKTEQAKATLTPIIRPTATYDTCQSEVLFFLENMGIIWDEWADTATLAMSTPRIALPSIIQDLQAIKRRMEALDPKSCTMPINLYDNLIGAMDEGILSWLAFLADEPESEIQEHLNKSLEYMNAVNEDLIIMQSLPTEQEEYIDFQLSP